MSIETDGIDLLNGEIEEFFKEIEFQNDQFTDQPIYDSHQVHHQTVHHPGHHQGHPGQHHPSSSHHGQPSTSHHGGHPQVHHGQSHTVQYVTTTAPAGEWAHGAPTQVVYQQGGQTYEIIENGQPIDMSNMQIIGEVQADGTIGEQFINDLLDDAPMESEPWMDGAMPPSQMAYQPQPTQPPAHHQPQSMPPSHASGSHHMQMHAGMAQEPKREPKRKRPAKQPSGGHSPRMITTNPHVRYPAPPMNQQKPPPQSLPGGNRVIGKKNSRPTPKAAMAHQYQPSASPPATKQNQPKGNVIKLGPASNLKLNNRVMSLGKVNVKKPGSNATSPHGSRQPSQSQGMPGHSQRERMVSSSHHSQGHPQMPHHMPGHVQHKSSPGGPRHHHPQYNSPGSQSIMPPTNVNTKRPTPKQQKKAMIKKKPQVMQQVGMQRPPGNKILSKQPGRHKQPSASSMMGDNMASPLSSMSLSPNPQHQPGHRKPPQQHLQQRRPLPILSGPPPLPERIVRHPVKETFINDKPWEPEKLKRPPKPKAPPVPKVSVPQVSVPLTTPTKTKPKSTPPPSLTKTKIEKRDPKSEIRKASAGIVMPAPRPTPPPSLHKIKPDSRKRSSERTASGSTLSAVGPMGSGGSIASSPGNKAVASPKSVSSIKEIKSTPDVQITSVSMPPPAPVKTPEPIRDRPPEKSVAAKETPKQDKPPDSEPPRAERSMSPKPSILDIVLLDLQAPQKPIETYGATDLRTKKSVKASKTRVRLSDESDSDDSESGNFVNFDEPQKPKDAAQQEAHFLQLQNLSKPNTPVKMPGSAGQPVPASPAQSVQDAPLDFTLPKKVATPPPPPVPMDVVVPAVVQPQVMPPPSIPMIPGMGTPVVVPQGNNLNAGQDLSKPTGGMFSGNLGAQMPMPTQTVNSLQTLQAQPQAPQPQPNNPPESSHPLVQDLSKPMKVQTIAPATTTTSTSPMKQQSSQLSPASAAVKQAAAAVLSLQNVAAQHLGVSPSKIPPDLLASLTSSLEEGAKKIQLAKQGGTGEPIAKTAVKESPKKEPVQTPPAVSKETAVPEPKPEEPVIDKPAKSLKLKIQKKGDKFLTRHAPPQVKELSLEEALKPVEPLCLEELGFISNATYKKRLKEEKKRLKAELKRAAKRKASTEHSDSQVATRRVSSADGETSGTPASDIHAFHQPDDMATDTEAPEMPVELPPPAVAEEPLTIPEPTPPKMTVDESSMDELPKKRMNYDTNFRYSPARDSQVPVLEEENNILTEDLDEYMKWAKPVSNYVPQRPPPHLGLDIDAWEKFPCVDCGDEYLFESGLKAHYARKSVLIELRCVQCQITLQFFNRCQLLRHARMHADQGTSMQFRDACVRTLPLKYLTATRPDTTSLQTKTISCQECSARFTTQTCLTLHFERIDHPEKCLTCQLQLPNPCARLAHERSHSLTPPYVCPETGRHFNDTPCYLDYISTQSCHKYRSNLFRTPSEASLDINNNISLFGNPPNFATPAGGSTGRPSSPVGEEIFVSYDRAVEYQLTRIRSYYQCIQCSLGFKSKKDLRVHAEAEHQVKVKDFGKMIFRCPYSEKVYHDRLSAEEDIRQCYLPEAFPGFSLHDMLFETAAGLRRHLRKYGSRNPQVSTQNTNKDRGGLMPRFKCPLCVLDAVEESSTIDEYFSQERDFYDHLNEVHGGIEDLRAVTAEAARTASLVLPDELLTKLYEREKEAEMIRKARLEEEKMEIEKQITERNKDVHILGDKHRTDVYPCAECKEVFLSAASRNQHMKKNHKEKWQEMENASLAGPLAAALRKSEEAKKKKDEPIDLTTEPNTTQPAQTPSSSQSSSQKSTPKDSKPSEPQVSRSTRASDKQSSETAAQQPTVSRPPVRQNRVLRNSQSTNSDNKTDGPNPSKVQRNLIVNHRKRGRPRKNF